MGRQSFLYKRRPKASWRSGYAADCKSVYLGSIPGEASIPSAQHISGKTGNRRFYSGRKALAHADISGFYRVQNHDCWQLAEHARQFDGLSHTKSM